MKRVVSCLVLLALLAGITAAATASVVHTADETARESHLEKTALVQQRLDGTLDLLAELCGNEYIRDPAVSYREKAALLTNLNLEEGLGYMMLRILDGEINIYREDQDQSTSNLGSRDYMQRLYTTGVPQVTDAFLAGADGKTINYTVASGIMEDGQVVGAIFAAIYGAEINEFLQDAQAVNVLVGSQLQYMGGISEDRFGLSVAQVLETEHRTSRPVENILTDFNEKRAGSFWGFHQGVQYFVYSPLAHADWVILTEVQVLPLVRNTLALYGCGVAVLLAAGLLVLRRKTPKAETAAAE